MGAPLLAITSVGILQAESGCSIWREGGTATTKFPAKRAGSDSALLCPPLSGQRRRQLVGLCRLTKTRTHILLRPTMSYYPIARQTLGLAPRGLLKINSSPESDRHARR